MTNDIRKQQLDEFFDHYRDVFNEALKADVPDIERTAELFSSCFLAANPSGVNCGENNDPFREALKKGYGFYKSIGMTSMDIVSKEITLLDDFHAMAKIHWKSNYLKRDGVKGSIEFDNIYFIQTRTDRHKVFAYITGDEQAALKAAGLVGA
jgi:hypothetical protein